MIDRLDWAAWPERSAREVMAKLAGATAVDQLAPLEITGRVAPLPFYEHWRLVVLSSIDRDAVPPAKLEDVYALWRDGGEPLLLDGESDPVHTANADESLKLDADHAADYVRFFCFALRADGQPFILFEESPEGSAGDRNAIAAARPMSVTGTDDAGNFLCEATVVYGGSAFHAVFSVPPDGEVTMVDDTPLDIVVPASLIPQQPELGLGPALTACLARVLPPAAKATVSGRRRMTGPRRASSAKRAPSSRPAVVELVELLLERALRAQSQNRLFGTFNATRPTTEPLKQFAALMLNASPVVIVETNMPFVEETIAEIVNALLKPAQRLDVCTANVGEDDSVIGFRLPSQGPALVLMPLQVYRRVVQVERLAFDIAAGDLAAVICCERFGQLPESLRRIKDVVLRLPALDEASFETLFARVLGHAPPGDWRAGGTEWVKHLLPTDFEHPRRMRLPHDKAIAFIRSEVADRLSDVDPGRGLGLGDLFGLGEARQFAEDLIADIHAATAGQLPWSQVDRGALLVGAPGTGKTTLARAIAKDCGVRFITASAAGWQAEGESLGPHIRAIRSTFSEARNYAPSILFIDEIDSLGSREAFAGTNNAIYQTEVVNAVLEEMNGLDPAAPVFVIGATNNEDGVDPALRRSGRLDRVIRIPRPNSAALDAIYRYYINALGSATPVDPALDPGALAGLSVGMTGADVERIVRGAARRARKASRPLSQADVFAEITDKPRGTDAFLALTPDELDRTATHEAGHALALYLGATKGLDIGFATIVPREGGVLGFVAPLPDGRVHLTRRDLEDKLEVFLAGRAAEELTYGEAQVSGGAGRDLELATELAIRMLTQLGLGGSRRLLWSATASPADLALAETTLAQAYERVLHQLGEHKTALAVLAKELVDRQEMTGDEVRGVLARVLKGPA